jgi:hypothetical protein
VRLTYNSGNDRWPDIFIPGQSSLSPSESAQAEPKAAAHSAPEAAETEPSQSGKKHKKGKR